MSKKSTKLPKFKVRRIRKKLANPTVFNKLLATLI